MSEDFDAKGLLQAIRESSKQYKVPLPDGITFCSICLGANMPEQKEYPEDSWRCGAWVDRLLPPLGICEKFRLDPEGLDALLKRIEPDGTKTMVVCSADNSDEEGA